MHVIVTLGDRHAIVQTAGLQNTMFESITTHSMPPGKSAFIDYLDEKQSFLTACLYGPPSDVPIDALSTHASAQLGRASVVGQSTVCVHRAFVQLPLDNNSTDQAE
jgi:hypothetical protein